MSSNHVLNAQPRDVSGTRASRRQRRDSYVPAVVYGAGKDSETVTLDHDQVMHSLEREAFHSAIIDLKTDAGSQQVILREVQMHPYRPLVLHMDFQRIKATETLHMKIPLHFEGADVAPGVKTDGGILAHSMTELDITCLPKDLPEYIAVDVSTLGMNESLHLSDIQLPEGVELTVTAYHEGEDPAVAMITAPKVVEDEVLAEEGDAVEGTGEESSADSEEGKSD
ncbi:MAG: 50S ribosomal protein L25/general stress protein Ctc [Proteobacteria bacterium]|nr:50S ribosomal protein L25/general stress protein Ctc [Pseudomonadota bacterium]MBT5819781.1 50S ribosomal protein L25/general stress protein Ctc [Pseudomonadota bacterium]MBT6348941.1 50S ribosomal protein L25/general stress protein Ctc [Pseudomonadota bacterium]